MDHVQHAINQHQHIQNRMHNEHHQRMNNDLLQKTMGRATASDGTDASISPGEAMFLTGGGIIGAANGGIAGLAFSNRDKMRARKEYDDAIGHVFRSADDVLQGGPIPENFADEFARVKQSIARGHDIQRANSQVRISPKAILGGGAAGLALGAGVGSIPIALRRMSEQRQSLDGQREDMNKTASTFF